MSEMNRLLAALTQDEYRRLEPKLTTVQLESKQQLYDVDQPIEAVYFPRNSMISLLTIVENGMPVEFATVGREGMAGVPVFLGATTVTHRAICQIPGEAVRMSAGDLRSETARGGTLRDLLQRYTVALFSQIAQHSSCNRTHVAEQRCAKWLLMTDDRVDDSRFPLTQEFLGMMLGLRRPGVSEVLGRMKRSGLVLYTRGMITIVDRRGLEAAACQCYWDIRKEFDRMLGPISPDGHDRTQGT